MSDGVSKISAEYNIAADPKVNPFMNRGKGVKAKVYAHADDNNYEYKLGSTYDAGNGNYLGGTVSDGKYYNKPVYGVMAGIGSGLGSLTYADSDINDSKDGVVGLKVPINKNLNLQGSRNLDSGDSRVVANYVKGNFAAELAAIRNKYTGDSVNGHLSYRF